MARNLKRIVTEISDINASGVMEMTEEEPLTQSHIVDVPDKFKAYVYINGKRETVLSGAVREKLRGYAGERSKRTVGVLFVNVRAYSPMSWGIGNISISYSLPGYNFSWNVNVGANGTFLPVITDHERFFATFGKKSGVISKAEVVSALTGLFRSVAENALRTLFNDASTPVFDSDFMLDEYKRKLVAAAARNENDERGVRFTQVTVSDIHVSEADMKLFRASLAEALKARSFRRRDTSGGTLGLARQKKQ